MTKATLRTTNNYDLFDLHEFNRDTRRLSYLEKSMRRYGWIDAYPMHVVRNGSKKLHIKGGHHRFEVAKKLGIPAKFIVCEDGGISIHELEKATNTWSMADYLTSYIRQGRPEYIAVKEYVEETGIPLGCAVSLLAVRCGDEYRICRDKIDALNVVGDLLDNLEKPAPIWRDHRPWKTRQPEPEII